MLQKPLIQILAAAVLSNFLSIFHLFIRATTIGFLALALASCTAPKFLVGVNNPAYPVSTTAGVRLHKLFLATSRLKASDPSIYFSGERATIPSYAFITASIPPDHQVGQIELPKTKVPDPSKDFLLIDPTIVESERVFIAEINQALASRPRGQRDILVFIHGYNNSLTDALLRAAQFVEDSGFQGVPVLFSWASRGKVLDYVYDMNSALLARDDLIGLFQLLDRTHASHYDILAHSMGNLLLIETIRQLKVQGKFDSHKKIGTVVMAAPDVDFDLFTSTLAKLTPSERKFYVLVSKKDKALKYARLVAGGVDRVGDANAQQVAELGVIAIDLSEVEDKTSLHHDTFADSPAVVQLIGRQIGEDEHFGALPPGSLVDLFADAKIAVFGG